MLDEDCYDKRRFFVWAVGVYFWFRVGFYFDVTRNFVLFEFLLRLEFGRMFSLLWFDWLFRCRFIDFWQLSIGDFELFLEFWSLVKEALLLFHSKKVDLNLGFYSFFLSSSGFIR